MILEWIQSDAMARMRMTGVVPTSLIVSCITWDLLLVYYRVKVNIIPAAFWTNLTIMMNNHWREETSKIALIVQKKCTLLHQFDNYRSLFPSLLAM